MTSAAARTASKPTLRSLSKTAEPNKRPAARRAGNSCQDVTIVRAPEAFLRGIRARRLDESGACSKMDGTWRGVRNGRTWRGLDGRLSCGRKPWGESRGSRVVNGARRASGAVRQ